MEHLETVEVRSDANLAEPFRMPVQWVNRPNLDFRGFSGLVASGSLKVGNPVRVLPSGKTSTVSKIVLFDQEMEEAQAGQSVTICLADEIDCSRGSVLAEADSSPEVSDQFEATIVWLDDDPMLAGRAYAMKLASQTVSATVAEPKYEININDPGSVRSLLRKR